MSAIDSFLDSLDEGRTRDAAVLARLRNARADELSRMVADPVTGPRVQTFVSSGAVYVDGAGICRIDENRVAAAQRRRARRLFSIFVAVVLFLLLPITMIVIISPHR